MGVSGIVESPAKVKTIKKLGSNNYEVDASGGRKGTFPKALDAGFVGYEPKYITIPGEKGMYFLPKLHKEVKRLIRFIWQLTQPDHGGAISWHLVRKHY